MRILGKGPSGEITTLGRGGSDITAFLIGHCLEANEVVIVTDVDGVMSTDPNKIEDAELLDEISVEEMRFGYSWSASPTSSRIKI